MLVRMTQQVINDDPTNEIVHMVVRDKISSVSLMADRVGVGDEAVVNIIKRAIEKGMLTGALTTDETRFFSGFAKRSDGPIVSTDVEAPQFSYIDTAVLKYCVITGAIMMVGGASSGGLAIAGFPMEAIGSAVAALGLLIIVFGCLYTLAMEK